MTISTTSASQLVAGDGINTTFSFGIIADSASDITVTYIDADGNYTILTSSQYTLLINPPTSNQLWGIGGNIVYPLSGSPIAAGTYLLVQRTIPLTQDVSVQNQGNYSAKVTEQALDTLCMEIQQVAARTGQMRGTWATGIIYNFGDVIVDGANGNNTGNYYMCAVANTSGTWTTDLAAGDWSLVINIQNINAVVGAYLPLIGGTISGNLAVGGTLGVTGVFTPTGGIAASTIAGSALISGGVANSKLGTMAANTVKVNNTSSVNNVTDISMASNTILGRANENNISAITLGTGLSLSTGGLRATYSPNVYNNTIAAPAATTNTTGVMMGLAASITTNSTGTLELNVCGTITNAGGFSSTAQLRYGTGAAPANGAALTGTAIGGQTLSSVSSGTTINPFALNAIVTGLSAASVYWADISLKASASSASVTNVNISIKELK